MELFEKLSRKFALFLYKTFFRVLAFLSKISYRCEARKLYLKKGDSLTRNQTRQIKRYWNRYTKDFDISFHKYYIKRTGKFDVRFIPDDLFAAYIDPYLNNREIESGVADKNYFDMYLKGFKMPKTYVHLINGQYLDNDYKIITFKKACDILVKEDRFIVKPSMVSYGGKNIKLFKNVKFSEIKKYLDSDISDNLIFQEAVEQSSVTAKLHPDSVNTIRIMTLMINGDIKTLHSSFRIGVGDAVVDNASSGGIYCGINDDNTLTNYACDAFGKKFNRHPDGGKFGDLDFIFMDKVRETVKAAAQRFPHFRLIGWDIAIDKKDEPIIIEANLTMSGLDVIQTICGPVFREYTEDVLDEVFRNATKREPYIDINQFI
ncbi:MAG: hypothetical protein LBK50_03590 [Candidatus Nomurabacteria bacterium]|jgi:hypothetical protein|nr:hypothetical protein [Candidatus Nomurabacteria bacterium]